MDVLCFHSNPEVRSEISRHLQEMDFTFECHPMEDAEGVRGAISGKEAKILLVETKKDTLEMYREISRICEGSLIIPMIKSIDRDIAISLEEEGRSYMLADSIYQFKESLMKILLRHEDKLGDFFREERVYKNVVYAYGFSWGRTYIVDIQKREEIYEIVRKLSERIETFIAYREKIPNLTERENVKSVWVTDIVGKNRIKPHNLTILTDNIIRFLEGGGKRIVVMDCVEYLLLYNDFINVLRNLELINSYAMEYNSLVIIIVDNNAYTTKEYSLLKRYSMEWAGA